VALAAVLHADQCEIYTDVDGVYTTDPRVLPEARRVSRISYDEMLELASAGAGVMHNRSIEFAKKFGVPVHVRTSFSDMPGTMIVADPESPDQPVCGAAVADAHVNVDMIIQNSSEEGHTDISCTIPAEDSAAADRALQGIVAKLGAKGFSSNEGIAKVSVIGAGMRTNPGVAALMFKTLADLGINLDMISTSPIKISAVIAKERSDEAVRALHDVFELDDTAIHHDKADRSSF
jgi:aspartate kinase